MKIRTICLHYFNSLDRLPYLLGSQRVGSTLYLDNYQLSITTSQRNWGFGLCYLYLRNVKGFHWNHKRFTVNFPEHVH